MLYYVCQYVYLYIHYTDNFELLWGCKLISALLFRPSCKSKQKLHALPITKLFYYFSTHTIKSIFVSPDSILKVATGYFRRQSWHRFKSRIRKEGKAHKIWTACILPGTRNSTLEGMNDVIVANLLDMCHKDDGQIFC